MKSGNIFPCNPHCFSSSNGYHLVLGDVEYALHFFNNCLESCAAVCLDQRLINKAAVGQRKAQKVAKCMTDSTKLLEEKTPNAALCALKMITEAMLISSYSEKLLELKAEALWLLQKYEEVIQLCERTLSLAVNNFAFDNQSEKMNGYEHERDSHVKLWRSCLISKSNFHLGRLDAALDSLEKLEQDGSIKEKSGTKILDSLLSLAVTIRKLLHCKNAGNEAFQSKKYAEAVEYYTVALSSNVKSRHFAAICYYNQAAAHQHLGQIANAIADCSLAITLDKSYTKAVSRRATLHEMIRDYQQAAHDLQRLISILEKCSNQQDRMSGREGGSIDLVIELTQAREQMSLMEEEAKKGTPLDLYLILGIKPSDKASKIQKAYRDTALRHHPDKASQFLAASEDIEEGRLWKEISQKVHGDSDRLFKMIEEAYAILSKPTKRSKYDLLDERLRKPSHVKSSIFDKYVKCKQKWHENWR